MTSHYRFECKHGHPAGQCRCPSNDKPVHLVPCEHHLCRREGDEVMASAWTPINPCPCCGMSLGTDGHRASTCPACIREEQTQDRRLRNG